MGQAWCKDRSSKAQDSKSPLDRVFVRCAHRIYPGLKEEGSVLGGATQRVTSSEIGYAGSPPRSALLRGRSIDSVDRPFHPSEWVDVNLEVPCTPRASVLLSGHRRQADRSKPSGRRSPGATTPAAPVPPPRRRRRRERRPLPPKPGSGGDAADDESEPEPLYSKLGPADSRDLEDSEDDEFPKIEHVLKKRSLEDVRVVTRPKSHSVTSLPNVADLLVGPRTARAKDDARRPPRYVKASSLPRDSAPFRPQIPERTYFSRMIEEDRAEEARPEHLSDPKNDKVPGFAAGHGTSTPLKLKGHSDDGDSLDLKDESALQESRRRDEDTGYESKTESQSLSDVSRLFRGSEELSSTSPREAIVDSFEESDNSRALVVAPIQRTISEESLPREMLVELDEEDSSLSSTRNDFEETITANGTDELDTPPPSPVSNTTGQSATGEGAESPRGASSVTGAAGNPTLMTPSLMELEVALTDMLEKKDEREREAAEEKSSDKLPAPQQIAALKDLEEPEPSRTSSRLIDFPRADRTNPFNDFKSDDLELPPEKPSRLHRISLMEESAGEEPQLVPTAPRRRHRNKSTLNASSETLHTYADRLI